MDTNTQAVTSQTAKTEKQDVNRAKTAYLIFDAESIPDGILLAKAKYPEQEITPEEAVAQAQAEAREASRTGSDFISVTYQIPVAVAIANVTADYRLQGLTCLDAPHYRTAEIVAQFWKGVEHYQDNQVKLVTFNGRGFDLPLMELAAFRYGISLPKYIKKVRNVSRYQESGHLDLMELVTNYGGFRMTGGLDLLSKLLGKPGKMSMKGENVYENYQQGKLQQINEYCCYDVLDTYFVFLRTRVLTGEITLADERELVATAKEWVTKQIEDQPHLQTYLDSWGDWEPWP